MTVNWFAIGGVVAVMFYGFVLAVAFRKPMAAGIKQLMSLRRATLGALGTLAIVATVEAQKPGDGDGGGSGTNDTNNAGMDLGDDGTNMMMMAGRSLPSLGVSLRTATEAGRLRSAELSSPFPAGTTFSLLNNSAPLESGAPEIPDFTVTAEDIARGYKQISETNDYNYSYAMPEGAIEIANIFAHGARSEFGLRVVDLTEFTFRLGTNDTSYSRFWLTLDGMAKTGIRTPFPFIAAGPGVGDALAVQGESRIWTKFIDNKQVITWENMHPGGDTNITENYQISLATGGNFETRSNEVCRTFEYVPSYDYDNDGLINDYDPNPTNYWEGVALGQASLSVPKTIMRYGNPQAVTASLGNIPAGVEASGTLSLSCHSTKVTLWTSPDMTTEMSLPLTLSAGAPQTIYVRGIEDSDYVGDVKFILSSTVGYDSCTVTQSMSVAHVMQMTMESPVQGTSVRPPPFWGELAHPFSVTNSPIPDQHLAIPFHNVATLGTNGFEVADFTVNMGLFLTPYAVDTSDLVAEWELIEALPQMSGYLETSGLTAQFRNPKQGGVYRFRGRIDECPWTEGNVVLPVCGAEISRRFESDLLLASNAVDRILASTDAEKRKDPDFLFTWFWGCGGGDYAGRADNTNNPTTWPYNQVNDDHGRGTVATLYGVPTRLGKLSNLMVGYATERLGVSQEYQEMGQDYGTQNDYTADYSWDVGCYLASGGHIHDTCTWAVDEIWNNADDKPRRLWPNLNPADNFIYSEVGFDYNHYFTSPDFILHGHDIFGEIVDESLIRNRNN